MNDKIHNKLLRLTNGFATLKETERDIRALCQKHEHDNSQQQNMIEILEGQLRVVDEVNAELNVIGMTGSLAWKAQMLRLRLKSQRSDIFDEVVNAIEEYLSEHSNEPYAHRSGVIGSITAVKNRMKPLADNKEV